MRRVIFGVLLVLVVATMAQAQTIRTDATGVKVDSQSHGAGPLVQPTGYVIDYYVQGTEGGSQPFQSSQVIPADQVTVQAGTPPKITATFAQGGGYPAGTAFFAKVRAVNGAGTSGSSNAVGPFGTPTVPVSPTSAVLVP